ncbi:MAG: hypothetical protein U0905_16840 [Pirellulales bacterium]
MSGAGFVDGSGARNRLEEAEASLPSPDAEEWSSPSTRCFAIWSQSSS